MKTGFSAGKAIVILGRAFAGARELRSCYCPDNLNGWSGLRAATGDLSHEPAFEPACKLA
jgi:hypothetical protein